MINGLRAVGQGLRNFRYMGYAYIWSNVAFIALSLPVVTAPAAFSALLRVGYLAQTDPSEADLAAFWETFKAHLLRALPWGLAMALFGVVNINNIVAYAPIDTPLVAALQGMWWIATVVWLGVLLYTWPLYYEMAEPSVAQATRNALIMVLQNPLFTLVILLALVLLAAISTVLVAAWLLLTFGAIAAIACAAVLNRLDAFRARGVSVREDAERVG